MQTGHDFLRAQVDNCLVQHQSLIDALRDHATNGEEQAFRALCERHLPMMEGHQRLVEEYGNSIGTDGGGAVKNALGAVLGKARDLVDSFRESDFLRLVSSVVMIRQSQDTFATFARAGEQLGERRLAELGRACEKDHDVMQREFNEYVARVFSAQVRAGAKDREVVTPTDGLATAAPMNRP